MRLAQTSSCGTKAGRTDREQRAGGCAESNYPEVLNATSISHQETPAKTNKMRAVFCVAMLLLAALLLVSSEAARIKKEKGKGSKGASDCVEWRYGNCVANNGDCGLGVREGSCDEQTRKLKCKVPCNWKKQFGADCKYKFGSWGECDSTSNTKTRSGTLKKALFHAECQPTIQVSKPCAQKTKPKGKKGKAKEN